MRFRKTYVEVRARIDAEGRMEPLEIVWRDGRSFLVDCVREAVRRSSQRVGGTGIRYLVSVEGRDRHLYYEDPRWFVEEVEPPDAAGKG